MRVLAADPPTIVSPAIYSSIASSPRLLRMVSPDGLATSPYEILDYQAVLVLRDSGGLRATVQRREKIRILQSRVTGILDHFWGDGVQLAGYAHSAGQLADSFRDDGRHHLVIALPRELARGETLEFQVARAAMVAFIQDQEWLETRLDHPTSKYTQYVVFPATRPCRSATLNRDGLEVPLPVQRLSAGVTLVRFTVRHPRLDAPYTVRWSW